MKRKIKNLLFGFIFLIGFGILVYPVVSNQWNTYRQSKLITHYNKVINEMKPEEFSEEWGRADNFNDSLGENDIYSDVFGIHEAGLQDTDYWKVLNMTGDGVMGYLSIPKLNIRLAIYHGTGKDVLRMGAGHLNGTKLPIGGEDTHSVLLAHRGMPSAKLFAEIDQLEKGDMFYIHVLDQVLAYEVDQVRDMVDKNDIETLQALLAIEKGKDQITLLTCTPYGANSHRLLVRGSRVPYEKEDEGVQTIAEKITERTVESVRNYYMIYLMVGLLVTGGVIVSVKLLLSKGHESK